MNPHEMMRKTMALVNSMINLDIRFNILSNYEVILGDFDLSFNPPFKDLI